MVLRLADSEGEEDDSTSSSPPRITSNVRELLNSDDDGDDDNGLNNDGEDEEEGEDLIVNAEQDYKRIDELDRYDEEDLDQEEYEEISQGERLKAEKELDKRDKEERKRQRRVPQALLFDDEDEAEEDDDDQPRRRRAQQRFSSAVEGSQGGQRADVDIDLENFDAQPDFLLSKQVEGEIKRRFRSFLETFTVQDTDGNVEYIYQTKIEDMCAKNHQSLMVSYAHLSETQPQLAVHLADSPKIVIPYLSEIATVLTLEKYQFYDTIHEKIHVRITQLPAPESLRDLRCTHLNSLMKVSGVVTRRTAVLPQLKHIRYRCKNPECNQLSRSFSLSESGKSSIKSLCPATCPDCGGKGTMKFDNEKTVYGSFQRLTLQESPGTVPAGRVPRQKDVILQDDLIDCARPGEEVEVTGIYVSNVDRGLNSANGFPVFSTMFEANYVQKKEDLLASFRVTDNEKKAIRKLAADPRIVDRIIGSIAPSIYGQETVKTAIALAMFGGREKNDDKHRIRGDINVLLLGDPGTAKSQCLKYVEKTAPRAVFTTGKGASAVGLTASVHKDPVSREWVLEGGALVLADRGVCLIDEFDKMNDRDRTSIHEAMEQQSISISKAGIVTTLQARCSVIAAANPIGGRYDAQRSFSENVELTDPILQRFDILCVLQDIVSPSDDERLAKFVVSSHLKSHPDFASGDLMEVFNQQNRGPSFVPSASIDQEMLKKYIIFSKSIKPKLNESTLDKDKIADVYVQLRKHSAESGHPIGVRHAESIIRMAEAFARMHLREFVQMDDFDMAIGVMVRSFIDAQRYTAKRTLQRAFAKYLSLKRDYDELLLFLLEEMVKEQLQPGDDHFEISALEFSQRAHEMNCERFVLDFLDSQRFRKAGFNVRSEANAKAIWKEFVV